MKVYFDRPLGLEWLIMSSGLVRVGAARVRVAPGIHKSQLKHPIVIERHVPIDGQLSHLSPIRGSSTTEARVGVTCGAGVPFRAGVRRMPHLQTIFLQDPIPFYDES